MAPMAGKTNSPPCPNQGLFECVCNGGGVLTETEAHGLLSVVGMHVIPLRGSAPEGLILRNTGPGLLQKQRKRKGQGQGEGADDVSLMWEVTSCPFPLCPPAQALHLQTPRNLNPISEPSETLCQSRPHAQLTTSSICLLTYSLALFTSSHPHCISYRCCSNAA